MAAKPGRNPTRRNVLDAVEEVRDVVSALSVELLGSNDPSSPNRGQRGQIAVHTETLQNHDKRIAALEAGQVQMAQVLSDIKASVGRVEKKFEPGTPADQAVQALKLAKAQGDLNKQRFRNAMLLLGSAILTSLATLLTLWVQG